MWQQQWPVWPGWQQWQPVQAWQPAQAWQPEQPGQPGQPGSSWQQPGQAQHGMPNWPGGGPAAASSADEDAVEDIPEIDFFRQNGGDQDFDSDGPAEDPDYDRDLCIKFMEKKRFFACWEKYRVDGTERVTDGILWSGLTVVNYSRRFQQKLLLEKSPEKREFLQQRKFDCQDMMTVIVDWAPHDTEMGMKRSPKKDLTLSWGMLWDTAQQNNSYVILTLPSRSYTRGFSTKKDVELHKMAVAIFKTDLRAQNRPQMYMDQQLCIFTFACPDVDSLIGSIKAKVQQGEMVIPLHRLQEDTYINLLTCVLHAMSDWRLALTFQVFRHVKEQRELSDPHSTGLPQLQRPVKADKDKVAATRKRLNTARSAFELFLVDRVLLYKPEATMVLGNAATWLTSRDLSMAAGKEGDMDVCEGSSACERLVRDLLSNVKASVNFAVRNGTGQAPRICRLHPEGVENTKQKCSLLFTDNVTVKDLPGSANKG